MPLSYKKLAILAKRETVAGTDSVPTGAANAMVVANAVLTPLEMDVQKRDIQRAYLGLTDNVIAATWQRIEFEVEAAGAGAAGTAPKYGPLLLACSMAEVISAGVSVTYQPVSGAFDRVTIYANIDGVLHKLLYGTADVEWIFTARRIPKLKFSFTGLYVAVSDAAAPVAVYTGWVKPLAVNKANTPTFTFFGSAAIVRELKFKMGNKIVYRNLIGDESVQAPDRAPTGTLVLEATTVAARNVWQAISLGNTGALAMTHGNNAGNILSLTLPSVQMLNPKYEDEDGIAMLSTDIELQPSTTGNDEIQFVVR